MTAIEAPGTGSDEGAGRFPGDPDMWLFVVVESLVFTSYFCIYLFSRTQHEAEFLEAQAALTMPLGILDTVVLLTSSWAIARCVQASREGNYRSALTNVLLTISFGVIFLVGKIIEWGTQIRMGNTFTSDEFFQHYFFLTSIHCIHVLIGFVVLGVVVYQLRSPQRRSQQLIETGATYWHTVDFLWVLIFALIYVVR